MQLLHRPGPVPGEHFRQHAEGEVDAGVEQFLPARGAAEHVTGNQAAVPRMADAKPQAMERILIAEPGR